MNRVIFATDRQRKDISGAEQHGELVFLLTGSEQPSPFRPEDVAYRFAARLREINFDPDRDCIALTGPVFLVSMFLASAVTWCDGRVNVLLFDATNDRYVLRPFAAERHPERFLPKGKTA